MWPAIIAGAATLGGALLGHKGAKDQRETTIELANTQHQRAVKDLRAAGLNPMLAVHGGAPTPPIGNPVGEGVSSAMEARALMSTLKLQDMQTKATEQAAIASQAAAAKSYTDQNRTKTLQPIEVAMMEATIDEIKARTSSAQSQARLLAVDAELRRLLLPMARNTARMAETKFGELLPYFSGASAIRNVLPFLRR